ncbi:MAG: transposase [Eggerthellaceae bacterium]|nr:transposase [Eggerthellaceae bacterium]
MAYVQGCDRSQLLFTSLDMMVAPDSPARVIDRFVDGLDLDGLGFEVAGKALEGRPAYDPKALLKLLLWGYCGNARSSRKLMRACSVNLEAMWLVEGVEPDYHTISNFRRDNAACVKAVFREFNARVLAVLGTGFVSVDGTKVRASNSKDRNFTASKLDDRIARLNGRAEECLRQMELADAGEEPPAGSLTRDELESKLAEARERVELYEGYRKAMEDGGLSQLSLTDADAKLMKSRNGFQVAYNVQAAVDSETHMLVNYAATDRPTDHGLLAPTAAPLKAGGGVVEAVADKGYIQDEDMVACLEAGVLPSVIPPDGVDAYEIDVGYAEAPGADPASTEPADLAACIHAGVVPDAYAGALEIGGPHDKKVFVADAAPGAPESPYGTEEEMRARAAEGYFVRDPERNAVWCPAGERLRQKSVKRNGDVRYANKTACARCGLRDRCGPQKCGWKEVDFGKDVLEKPIRGFGAKAAPGSRAARGHYETRRVVTLRLAPDKEKCAQRMCLSEHPFGTIKRAMGADHFLLRGLEKVDAEFGLLAIGYNLARAIGILGFDGLMGAVA